MGLFNFIETFFFISLGITFILILLLVYHFKQRLYNLEQKSNSMIYIINDLVKEFTTVKQLSNVMCSQPHNKSNYLPNSLLYNNFTIKEDDNEDEDEDEDDSDDGDEDTNDNSDEDEDSDEDTVKILILDNITNDYALNEESIHCSIDETIPVIGEDAFFLETLVSDLIYEIPVSPVSDLINEKTVSPVSDLINEIPVSPVSDLIDDEISCNLDLALGENQLESSIPIMPEVGEITSNWNENGIDESYKKMSIPELRSIVISKGLTQDASKMKKSELFKLLQV